jgi:hypothetical protein
MLVCERYGTRLRAGRTDQRYCGPACRQRSYRERRRNAAREAVVEQVDRFAELEEAVGRSAAENVLIARITAAARDDWRASAWLLRYLHGWAAPPQAVERVPDAQAKADVDDPLAEVDELREARSTRAS